MISNVVLHKTLRFIRIFNPDLRQYRIKSALFPSPNPNFSAFPRCCVLKCTDWSLGTIQQLSDATQACSPSPTNA